MVLSKNKQTTMKLLSVIVFVVSLFSISCSSIPESEQGISTMNPIEINLSRGSTKTSHNLSEIIEFRDVIQLESNEDAFIKEASKIIFNGNNIYILDKIQDKLFVFNINGNFISQILTRGKGPGEIINASGFELDRINQELIVSSLERKELLVFSTNGEFKRSHYIHSNSRYFTSLDESKFCFFVGYYDSSFHNLRITDKTGETIKYGFPFPEDLSSMHFSFSGYLTKNNEGALYNDACSNDIYQIVKNGDAYLKYRIVFDGKTWPENKKYDFMNFFMELNKMELCFIKTNYMETRKGMIIPYQAGKKIEKAFYNRNTGDVFIVNQNLVKDVFFPTLSNPVGVTESDDFISTVDPLPLKERLLQETSDHKAFLIDSLVLDKIMCSSENNSNLVIVTYNFI